MVNSKLNNDKFLLTYSEQAKGTLLCQIGCHGCCGAALPPYYRNLNVYYKLYIFLFFVREEIYVHIMPVVYGLAHMSR